MTIKSYVQYTTVFILSITLVTLLLIVLGIYNNNSETDKTSKQSLQQSLDDAVSWLETNQETLIKNHNSGLWWIIREASLESDNNRIKKFYLNYKHSFIDKRPRSVWSPYFYDDYKPIINDITDLYPRREYQLLFIYALSCNANMKDEAIIQKQLHADYCKNHFLNTRCVTHQQMAVRQLNKTQCGDYSTLSNELLDIIQQEITYDFRVTDSYIQRALMLAESKVNLKPIWIARILDAQQADGGWADFYPIITLGSKQIGSASTSIQIGPKKSRFHATAQAIWLLTLLINQT